MERTTKDDASVSGDGAATEPPVDKKQKREKPLAIRGTLDDVLRAAMNVKPKDEQAQHR